MNITLPRIVFMGTPEFAVHVLEQLITHHYPVVAVVTVPDKPAGRGKKLTASPVKTFAQLHDIPVLQPEKLKDPDFAAQLKSYEADLQVVVAFRMLPEVVWAMPRLGTFNLHASLLPQYRGAAPINHAIINGETETGITTFLLDKQIDTGNILFAQKVVIEPTDNAGSLHDKLMVEGGQLVLKTVAALAAGTVEPKSQDGLSENKVLNPAPKIFKDTCKINWEMPAIQIYNLIRGLSPYPAAWTQLTKDADTFSLKIYAANLLEQVHTDACGVVRTDNKTYLHIAVKGGVIEITELQKEGKKRIQVTEFLRGFNPEGYLAG